MKNSLKIVEMDAPKSNRAELNTSKIMIWICGRCATCRDKSLDFDVGDVYERLVWHLIRAEETCKKFTRLSGNPSDVHVQSSELVMKTFLMENNCFYDLDHNDVDS